MAIAQPGDEMSTHDLILTDKDGNTVELILCDKKGDRDVLAFAPSPMPSGSLKMYEGTQKYSDMDPPWTPIAQSDWSGGRGGKDFDNDATKYYDGKNINTLRPGEIILGPKATETHGTATSTFSNTAATTYSRVTCPTGYRYYAYKFTSTENFLATHVRVTLKGDGVSFGQIYVGFAGLTGSPSAPGTVTYSSNFVQHDELEAGVGQDYTFTLSTAFDLDAGVAYAIVFKIINIYDDTASFYIKDSTSSDTYWESLNGTTWPTTYETDGVYFTAYIPITKAKWFPFEYKGALYVVGKNDDASAAKMYLNGDQGVVASATSTVVTTSSGVKTWAENEAAGSIIKIFSGAGANQPQNWRVISSNTASSASPGATTFTTLTAWDVAPAANDIYAIVASDTWTEIWASRMATWDIDVTDVLAVNGAIYLACGDTKVLKTSIGYNLSGTWTYAHSGVNEKFDVQTSAYTYLKYGENFERAPVIWGAKGGFPAKISNALAVDCTAYSTGADVIAELGFITDIPVGDLGERITGLEIYPDPYYNLSTLYILKEGSTHYVYRGTAADIPTEILIREYASTADYRNGRAHSVHSEYMYFSWQDTLLRYHASSNKLDTVGPDKAEVGYPTANRAGYFSCLAGHAGVVFGGIDAGNDGISSVLANNGQGWCELLAAPSTGERIQRLYAQSIPGNTVDRLWVSMGSKLYWIPISRDPYNHPDSSYYFADEGYIITPWYYIGRQAVDKYFNALKIVNENTSSSPGEPYVIASYQIDDDADWSDIPGVYDTFVNELNLSDSYDKSGKRIRFKYTLYSDTAQEDSPRIISSVLETAVRVPVKYVTNVMVRLADDDHQRDGVPDGIRLAILKLNKLKAMQALATPVRIESSLDLLDGSYGFVDNVTPIQIAVKDKEGKANRYINTFSLIEVLNDVYEVALMNFSTNEATAFIPVVI